MIDSAGVVGTGVKVEIWSDVVCPWCYIGKRRFEAALAGFEHRDEVEVVWRSFELDPAAAGVREGGYVDRLATKYAVSVAEAQAMIDRMTKVAAEHGLQFDFGIARPGNTFDAHRLIHLARRRGVQDAVKERLLAATFVEGEAIGDRETLVRLGTEAGLDVDEIRSALESDAYAEEVRADERAAVEYGITAVPFFAVDGRYGMAGAQPTAALESALDRAWAERRSSHLEGIGDAVVPACEDDTCAV